MQTLLINAVIITIDHSSENPLSTPTDVLFPGHNHLLTTGADDASLAGPQATTSVRSLAPVVSRWL